MKKLILMIVAAFLTMSVAGASVNNEPKKVMRSITDDLTECLDCHVERMCHDRAVGLTYATLQCPGLWMGDMEYAVNNIIDLFGNCANIYCNGWYIAREGCATGDYVYLKDTEVTYTVTFTYYKDTNCLMIVLWKNE